MASPPSLPEMPRSEDREEIIEIYMSQGRTREMAEQQIDIDLQELAQKAKDLQDELEDD